MFYGNPILLESYSAGLVNRWHNLVKSTFRCMTRPPPPFRLT
jgi:hypothetical protein